MRQVDRSHFVCCFPH